MMLTRILLLGMGLCAFWPLIVDAAQITKVKGKSALIDLKGDPAAPGDTFFAIGSDGKRKAIIKLSKVKGGKAIGRILKGKPAAGMDLELRPDGVAKTQSARPTPSSGSTGPSGRSYWGAFFGYAQDSMKVNVNSFFTGAFLETVSLSGSGFSAKGLFDYELFDQVWFRGTSGVEMFNASGPTRCGTNNAEACTAKITYGTIDLIGRYVFSKGGFRPWLGAGVGLLFPISKDATALASNSISTTNVILVTGGVDWHMSPKFFIPISVEYGLLPKSDEVEANWIALRIGFGMPL